MSSPIALPNTKEGLEAFRIGGLPPEFYYIPNFITPEEEASILDKVGSVLATFKSNSFFRFSNPPLASGSIFTD